MINVRRLRITDYGLRIADYGLEDWPMGNFYKRADTRYFSLNP